MSEPDVERIRERLETAKANAETTKPRIYGHADKIMYESTAAKNIHLWSEAYVADVGAVLDVVEAQRGRVRQMEEEIEGLHIALRASGERREKVERLVRQMEEALEEIVRAHENPTKMESFRGELDAGRLVGIAERGLAAKEPEEFTSGEATEAEPEDTSDFYLDSFHRTWNREF